VCSGSFRIGPLGFCLGGDARTTPLGRLPKLSGNSIRWYVVEADSRTSEDGKRLDFREVVTFRDRHEVSLWWKGRSMGALVFADSSREAARASPPRRVGNQAQYSVEAEGAQARPVYAQLVRMDPRETLGKKRLDLAGCWPGAPRKSERTFCRRFKGPDVGLHPATRFCRGPAAPCKQLGTGLRAERLVKAARPRRRARILHPPSTCPRVVSKRPVGHVAFWNTGGAHIGDR